MAWLDLAGQRLDLLPQRAAFLPALRTLLVADAHIGKAVSFRRLGVPVPEATTAGTLARLTASPWISSPVATPRRTARSSSVSAFANWLTSSGVSSAASVQNSALRTAGSRSLTAIRLSAGKASGRRSRSIRARMSLRTNGEEWSSSRTKAPVSAG